MFRIIDLTQTLSDESLSYPGTKKAWTAVRRDLGSSVATVTRFSSFDPHAGTHLDAPRHFSPSAPDLATLELRLRNATVVSIGGANVEAADVPEDCSGRAVLFSTGWEDRAGTPEYFRGYPVVSSDAARLLVQRGVGLIGVDTPSVDGTDDHPRYPAHEILAEAHVPIVEGLVNLHALLTIEHEILFAAFPLKLRGVEGSPIRALALVQDPAKP